MVCKIGDRKFFSDVLQRNIDQQLERVDNKYASCIIVDGGVGKSKTCTCRQIADYISIKRGCGLIELDKQLARGGKELFEKVPVCLQNKLPVLIYDEAGDFSKKRVLTDFNLGLCRFFEQYRQFGIVLIVSLPLMDSLDRTLLDLEIVRFLLHVESRTKTQNNCKVFSLHRLFYIKGRMKKLEQKSFAYKIIKPNFFCHVNRLPANLEKELEAYSLAGKKKDVKNANIVANGLVSMKDIGEKLNRSETWVRKSIIQNKIKEKQIIGKKKYFHDSIIERLQDYHVKFN